MADKDATAKTDESPETESTTESSSESTGTTESEVIASYRKRQAGAEAARQVAEQKLRDALAELEPLRAKGRTESEKEAGELATLRANLAAAERRADEADAKAEARVLDAKYPNARKKIPEITDEVRLAEFEAIFADEGAAPDESPTPKRNNGPQNEGSDKTEVKAETSADIEAKLRKMAIPW